MKKFLIFMLCAVCCAMLASCRGERHVPFRAIPDADLGSAKFERLIKNLTQYQNIYSHLMLEHIRARGGDSLAELEDDDDGFRLALHEAAYNYWLERDPAMVGAIRANVPRLYDMNNRINRHNYILHFEAMKHVIDSYVSALYINSPAPPAAVEPLTDAHGEPVPEPTTFFPPVDLEHARANIASFVTPEFLAKNPHAAVANYLHEHNINVKRIIFNPVFTSFNHHVYPFRIEYRFRIEYYIGDEPVPESRWRSAAVQAVFFVTMNEEREYVIAYVSDPWAVREQIDPYAPSIEDFMQ